MPAANRSVFVIGFSHRDWFLRADPPDRHTKTCWCFIGPDLQLKPPGKNHCAAQACPGSHRPLQVRGGEKRATLRQMTDQLHIIRPLTSKFIVS